MVENIHRKMQSGAREEEKRRGRARYTLVSGVLLK